MWLVLFPGSFVSVSIYIGFMYINTWLFFELFCSEDLSVTVILFPLEMNWRAELLRVHFNLKSLLRTSELLLILRTWGEVLSISRWGQWDKIWAFCLFFRCWIHVYSKMISAWTLERSENTPGRPRLYGLSLASALN